MPTPATCPGRCWPSSAAPTSSWATRNAGSTTARTKVSINAKLKAAFRNKLTPILCVGEDESVRSEGRHVEHTTWQLRTALADIPAEDVSQIVVAYEPVWAIGTGAVASPDDAQEVAAALRSTLAELHSGDLAAGVRILYGGSCKADNVVGIMSQPDVDGALVGGASLDPDEFVAICRYQQRAESEGSGGADGS